MANVPEPDDFDFEAEVSSNITTRGGQCGVAKALRKLPPKAAAGLERMLAKDKDDVPHTAIAKALSDRGLFIRADTVARHRRRICTCGR